MASNFDDFKLAVEALSGGKNTVILDDVGMPSVVVAFPKHTNKELFGGSDQTHSGHIVNGVEKSVIYVDKFLNIVYRGRGYSLPMRDPATYVNFDQAIQYARNKGKGWSLMPYSTWAEIALWCRKNGTMPRGNNNYGHDIDYPLEQGVASAYDGVDSAGNKRTGRTATGSGPVTWNHNWQADGIADMNGNCHEWTAGLRLMNGEIQIIPYANVFDPEVSLASTSSFWKAIKKDGSIVDPGTADTLKYDNKGGITLCTTLTYAKDDGIGVGYTNMPIETGLTAPELAKALILYPDNPGGDYGGDEHYMDNSGERLSYCGGAWYHASSLTGVFKVNVNNPRSYAGNSLGFRSAFCEL